MSRSIYVAKSEPGPIKVGISSNPRDRIASLRTASAVGISLAYLGRCESPGTAEVLEKRAHELLHNHHRRGEWFDCAVETAVAAVLQAASDLGYSIEPLSIEIKKTGRPKTGRNPIPIVGVRMTPDLRHKIEDWANVQPVPMNLSDAIRSLVESALPQSSASSDCSAPKHPPRKP